MVLAHLTEHVGSEAAGRELPKVLRDILTKARTSWLRNQEVVDLLSRHRQYGFRVSKEPPQKPPGVCTITVHWCNIVCATSMPIEIHVRLSAWVVPFGPCMPRLAGGSLFLFNRKSVRFFRKDGHDWRKKADGKTVRETHEKLKVGQSSGLSSSLCDAAHILD